MTGLLSNLQFLVETLFLIGIVWLAFWLRDMIIYMIAGTILIMIGLSWIHAYSASSIYYTWYGIAVCTLGVYMVAFKGLVAVVTSDKPSRGWSQVKGWWSKGKGE